MPYADNLYSADDSETESFSEALSPTDGYFTNRVVPSTAVVPDPSLDDETTNEVSKAREAREEAQADVESHSLSRRPTTETNRTSSSRATPLALTDSGPFSAYNASSPTNLSSGGDVSFLGQSGDAYSENTPLLHSVAPPPAYSAATSSASQPPSQPSRSSYRTLSDHELERGLSARRDPESMGGPNDITERTPIWRDRISKLPPWRRLIKHFLLIALVLSLIVTFIVGTIKFSKNTTMPKNPGDKPHLPAPDEGSTIGHGRFCSSATIHIQDSLPTYEFRSGERLGILQVNSDSAMPQGPNHISTSGQINFQRLPADSRDPATGLITFDAWVSHSGIGIQVEMDPESQALRVATPLSTTISHSEELCISIEINVWLPDGASFGTLQAWTSDLSIQVCDDVNIEISERGTFQTFHGQVMFPTLNATELLKKGYTTPAAVTLQKPDTELKDRYEELEDPEKISVTAASRTAYPAYPPYPTAIQPPSPPTPPTPPDIPTPPAYPSPPTYPTSPIYRDPSSPYERDGGQHQDTPRTQSTGLHCREIYVDTSSGAISGAYHLFDILEINSQSGSVRVHVIPEPVLKTDPKPARLRIETMSGSILAHNPVYNDASIPVRDYRTRITSISGSLRGSFIIGTEAIFKTNSGNLEIIALPDTISEPAIFNTECTSGSSRIHVLSPLLDRSSRRETVKEPNTDVGNDDPYLLIPKEPGIPQDDFESARRSTTALRKLRSKHEANSGSHQIRYPSAWEGQIDALTISGSIRVGGEGVRTIRDNRRNWAYREVVARKGPDATHASTMTVDGISGSEEIWVGDGCKDDGRWCKEEA